MDGRFGESHEICYEFVLINLYINSLNFLFFFRLKLPDVNLGANLEHVPMLMLRRA